MIFLKNRKKRNVKTEMIKRLPIRLSCSTNYFVFNLLQSLACFSQAFLSYVLQRAVYTHTLVLRCNDFFEMIKMGGEVEAIEQTRVFRGFFRN